MGRELRKTGGTAKTRTIRNGYEKVEIRDNKGKVKGGEGWVVKFSPTERRSGNKV